jgi:hypothetical protein
MFDILQGDGESLPEPVVDIKSSNMNEIENTTARCAKPLLFNVNIRLDLIAVSLFVLGLASRLYHLEEPRNIV